jgi:hypothetical protein
MGRKIAEADAVAHVRRHLKALGNWRRAAARRGRELRLYNECSWSMFRARNLMR